MLTNKFLKTGFGSGQIIGGGPSYYSISGNLAFFRDDFTGAAIDTDEWIQTVSGTSITGISSAGIYTSAGYAVFAAQTATLGIMRLTSKRSYSIPFRFEAAVSIDGIGTGMEVIMQVRDTAGVTATTASATPTYLARWRHVGSAGGTEHSSATEIQVGGTAAANVPGGTAQTFSMSGAAGAISGSASIGYIIDVDKNGVTFGTHSTSALSLATSAFTTLPPPPFVLAHFPSPMLPANRQYCVEFVVNLGSAAIETGQGPANGGANSAFVKVWFAQVQQYAPAAGFQRTGPIPIYSLTPTAGGGAITSSALLQMGGYFKWY